MEKYLKLFEITAKMRHHQIRHWKYKTSVDLEKAKYYERQVDRMIKEDLKELPDSMKLELFK